jgi:diguanylate cyclase (GGDEF)-like protein
MQPRSYRFYLVMNWICIISVLSHLLFSTAFASLKLFDLAIYMALTTFLWIGIYLLNQRGYHKAAYYLAMLETYALGAFASFTLGWQSGFFLYILVMVLLTFVNSKLSQFVQVSFGILSAFLLVTIFAFSPAEPVLGVYDRYLTAMNLLIMVVMLAYAGHYFEVSARVAEAELLNTNRTLLNLATTDPVTNLINRRNMMLRIEQEREKLNLNGLPFTLIMLDIDNFKHVNDAYGHDCGDFVLVAIAETISQVIRKQDQVARWGGDEFLVMLPETDLTGGGIAAEKIRNKILRTPFVYHDLTIPVTMTLGVGLCEKTGGIGAWIRKADQALYEGKQAGKNRVTLAQ